MLSQIVTAEQGSSTVRSLFAMAWSSLVVGDEQLWNNVMLVLHFLAI